jgi:hypothetical protein
LLFGYAPCTLEQDKELRDLDVSRKDGVEERNAWREEVGWSRLTPLQKKKCKENDEKYQNLAWGKYDKVKKELKTGINRIHPNICDYTHLDKIDHQAEGYDKDLNNIIPEILKLVDKRIR